jgi:hypothetical protein
VGKRLIDGVWQKDKIKPGFGLRSRMIRQQMPNKREYKKMLKKGVTVPPVNRLYRNRFHLYHHPVAHRLRRIN